MGIGTTGVDNTADEPLPIGRQVSLPAYLGEPVVLEAVRRGGSGYECRVRLPGGSPDETIPSVEGAADRLRRLGRLGLRAMLRRRLNRTK